MATNSAPTRRLLGFLPATAALMLAACTITPSSPVTLDSASQVVTYAGFLPLASRTVVVQAQNCQTGAWQDVASTTSASTPASTDSCGTSVYAWSVNAVMPPLPVWCVSAFGVRTINSRAVLRTPGQADYVLRTPIQGCTPSKNCFGTRWSECMDASGVIFNYCGTQECIGG